MAELTVDEFRGKLKTLERENAEAGYPGFLIFWVKDAGDGWASDAYAMTVEELVTDAIDLVQRGEMKSLDEYWREAVHTVEDYTQDLSFQVDSGEVESMDELLRRYVYDVEKFLVE